MIIILLCVSGIALILSIISLCIKRGVSEIELRREGDYMMREYRAYNTRILALEHPFLFKCGERFIIDKYKYWINKCEHPTGDSNSYSGGNLDNKYTLGGERGCLVMYEKDLLNTLKA